MQRLAAILSVITLLLLLALPASAQGTQQTGVSCYEGTETLNNDMTNTATVMFEGAAPDNAGALPAQLPDTGVAGVAAIIAALAALLLAIGQRLLRWIKRHP